MNVECWSNDKDFDTIQISSEQTSERNVSGEKKKGTVVWKQFKKGGESGEIDQETIKSSHVSRAHFITLSTEYT